MISPEALRARAEAKFKKKEFQRLDGYSAAAEYEEASRATTEKTARLRALRMSRQGQPEAATPKTRDRRAHKVARPV